MFRDNLPFPLITVSVNNIDNQLDATITVYLQFQSTQHVSSNYFAHPQER